jgi:hypothetical protein
MRYGAPAGIYINSQEITRLSQSNVHETYAVPFFDIAMTSYDVRHNASWVRIALLKSIEQRTLSSNGETVMLSMISEKVST